METLKLCNRYRVAVMPGTTTLNGVITALEYGADVVKIFPGEILGMKAIKAIHGPLPQAPLMPTGGVHVENDRRCQRRKCR
ncbi:possible 4-hydroxy-2-oxoglutarate aldolase [Megasphaera elsdenii CAG:570]|uniref:Possible 4-hydroxy-2-oxoglutarate aldolase n=1 Tax=Megasphaera elsdenii CAG:570 TaxID=1263087 RepID=R7MZC6_MEGEL|nr:possible 4-hydroxy-2-oxoglutarate aldolase [Megasphaera elsdenii CAG:570]